MRKFIIDIYEKSVELNKKNPTKFGLNVIKKLVKNDIEFVFWFDPVKKIFVLEFFNSVTANLAEYYVNNI